MHMHLPNIYRRELADVAQIYCHTETFTVPSQQPNKPFVRVGANSCPPAAQSQKPAAAPERRKSGTLRTLPL
jgi:hypothetical protein